MPQELLAKLLLFLMQAGGWVVHHPLLMLRVGEVAPACCALRKHVRHRSLWLTLEAPPFLTKGWRSSRHRACASEPCARHHRNLWPFVRKGRSLPSRPARGSCSMRASPPPNTERGRPAASPPTCLEVGKFNSGYRKSCPTAVLFCHSLNYLHLLILSSHSPPSTFLYSKTFSLSFLGSSGQLN